MQGAYAKITAVLAVLIAVLAINGYLAYRYYDRLDNDQAASISTTTSETTAAQTLAERTDGAVFVHRAAPQNIIDNSTYIDHPLTTGNPDAVLLVTQVRDPGSDAVDNARPIGVWYDANRGGEWAIFNQDLAPMPEGATFNVVVSEEPSEASGAAGGVDGSVFVHRAAPDNTVEGSTYVDHPLVDEDPDAVLSVTPNWNPGGGGGIYDNHPVGVRYDADRTEWAIFNQDLAPMPEGAAFNVLVSEEPSEDFGAVGVEGAVFAHRAAPGKTVEGSTRRARIRTAGTTTAVCCST